MKIETSPDDMLDSVTAQELAGAGPQKINDVLMKLLDERPSDLPTLNEYGIYDTLLKGYDTHFSSMNDATAVRELKQLLLQGHPRYSASPEHFVLEYIGQWDQGSGDLLPDEHRRILNLKEILHGTS